MQVALDIEADGLDPTRVWCIVTVNLQTQEVKCYEEGDYERFKLDASSYSLVVGHNLIGYDLPVLRRLVDYIPASTTLVRDTLVLSHLLKYDIEGGHSLDSWGQRLKFPKQEFHDFSKYTPQMLEYCINDTKLSAKLYEYFTKRLGVNFDKAVGVEHYVQEILQRDVKEGGYPYDKAKADYLRSILTKKLEGLDQLILDAFPPRPVPNGVYVPKLTKFGTISRSSLRWWDGDDFTVFTPGAEFTRLSWELFNPGSVVQVVRRLTDNGWWDPIDRTDGWLEAKRTRNKDKLRKLDRYGWKLNEQNLSTLTPDAPDGAKLLVERLALNSRLTMLDMWERAYDPDTKSVHPTIEGIGTWTHRCSHRNPNIANIATAKTIKYKNPELSKAVIQLGACTRSLFHSSGHWQVGCDADGIQLRLFAHYAGDQALIEANVNGRKELGTDVHTLNQLALGDVCRTRDDAKTWIYAYLLGAGDFKLATILKCDLNRAKQAKENLLKTYASITKLRKEIIPRDAARGYFVGLDGRYVCCSSEHLMLSGYLQNGEKLIMAYALREAKRRFEQEQLNARLLTWVHDEFQWQVKGKLEDAHRVGQITSECITWAGEHLECKCPQKGNYSVGRNWFATH